MSHSRSILRKEHKLKRPDPPTHAEIREFARLYKVAHHGQYAETLVEMRWAFEQGMLTEEKYDAMIRYWRLTQ